MKHPVTMFGETDEMRYQRLALLEEKHSVDVKKSQKDETAKAFMLEDHEVELLKFMKQQENILKEQ